MNKKSNVFSFATGERLDAARLVKPKSNAPEHIEAVLRVLNQNKRKIKNITVGFTMGDDMFTLTDSKTTMWDLCAMLKYMDDEVTFAE